MFSYIYHSYIFNPLYNGLVFLIDVFPWMDAGIAVIVFTIIVRLILFPISKKSIITQVRMKQIEPELAKIREKTGNDKQAQALQTMALYKAKGVSPFSSFFLLFLQIPIIYALYSIFIHSGLPEVNKEILYGFVSVPVINMHFLGLIDIGIRNIPLSIIAGISQFLQLHFSPATRSVSYKSGASNPNDIAQNMTRNLKYFFPIMVFLISYKISSVVALYWTVSSLFTLAQELYVRKYHIR